MTEKPKNESVRGKNGGRRPGAGRKKGSKNRATLEQQAVKKAFDQRVLRTVDRLFDSQMTIARGASYLYCIDTDEKGNKSKPRLVTAEWEIEQFLNGETHDPSQYYYITTERPDNKAIDSMLDRVFGKAKQIHEGGGPESSPIEHHHTFEDLTDEQIDTEIARRQDSVS